MRKIAVLFVLLVGVFGDAVGAARPTSGRTAVRATTVSRTTPRVATQPVAEAKTVSRARAAAPVATSGQSVVARAATTKKVVGTGTKVAVAAKNVVVNEECQQKFYGCMDSFCMLENGTGGRCLCSNKNKELDTVLEEIEKLDQQTYQMATYGVERIEMGEDAEAVIAKANAVAQSVIENADGGVEKKRKTLDLSLWEDVIEEVEFEDVFGGDTASIIDGKEGDALYSESLNICRAQIPECASDMQMLQLMYVQNIKSDCTAYENSLKQQKKSSAQKLVAAERALREAALEQFRTANKYDLGQCTVEFKKCMQSTGGCGDDFSKCATVVAMENTNASSGKGKKSKGYQIKGTATTIEISASTYDTLLGKKPLCEHVTKSCVNVAGQVWDTFLREVAPQVKNAELIAEDKVRQDCIGNISSCFQKACRDNIDPNDPNGSYDLCLTRPGTLLNLCRVPLNVCGIDASSQATAEKSDVWDFVLARLASMRVNSCTTEVKECLQSEDRCGKDYSQCIGLDTDTIIRMCPYDKLTGCQKMYGDINIRGEAVYDELANMVQGIMLNIDNAALTECQAAVDEAMIRVCGNTENCNGLTTVDNIGANSLEYKICEYTVSDSGIDVDFSRCRTSIEQIKTLEIGGELSTEMLFAGVLDGTIYWEAVEVSEDGRLISVDEYMAKIDDAQNMSAQQKDRVKSELAVVQANIDAAINAIEADPKVQFCMTGRQVQGLRRTNAEGASVQTNIGDKNAARFPELTKQMRSIIATSALKIAKDNYYKKYDELNEKMLQDYVTMAEDARREIARQACVGFAEMSVLPKASSIYDQVFPGGEVTGAAVAIPLTGGASTVALGDRQLIGSKQLNQWNYRESITSTFEWETLKCERCIRSRDCVKIKSPMYGYPYCKDWDEEKNECSTIQF
ncbi:MAG: hypothetical protein R8N50_02585 [Alphaproteobacteria bacterium]|nr:hypothetical protein [Alphaproteobacteria bacterium]